MNDFYDGYNFFRMSLKHIGWGINNHLVKTLAKQDKE